MRVDIENLELAATTPEEMVLLINDALERLQAQDPERARVVLLKFFGGLTNQEVAESMGVTERTIERQWAYAKAKLFRVIQDELSSRGSQADSPFAEIEARVLHRAEGGQIAL